MFDLKSPCSNCPFRKGLGETFMLGGARLREIKEAASFQCHKTVDYSSSTIGRPGDKPQQCAGLMAVLLREKHTNTIMRAGMFFDYLKPEELDPRKETYQSWDEVLKAHGADE